MIADGKIGKACELAEKYDSNESHFRIYEAIQKLADIRLC